MAKAEVDGWLLSGFALLLGGCAAVAPWAVLAYLGVALVLLGRSLGVGPLVLLLCVLVVASLRAQIALADFEQRRIEARDALGEPRVCAGHASVVESPVALHGALRLIVAFESLDCEGHELAGPVDVRLYGGPAELTRGARVFAVTKLGALRQFRNTGVSDPAVFAARQGVVFSGSTLSMQVERRAGGIRAWVDRARQFVRQRIRQTFAPGAEALARALVLGESDLAPEDDAAFRQSGLSHLLAVSGTHLVFAVVSLVAALRALLLRVPWLSERMHVARLASLFGIVLALAYADFAGGSGSAWRAAWMLVVVFAARVVERRPNAARVIALTVLVGTAFDPLVCFDISFMLSLAATAGLFLIGQPLVRRCQRIGFAPLRYAAVSLAATVASMIPCAPLLASISPQLTLAGLLANVVAAPIGELAALPVCLGHAIAAPLPALERGLGLVGSGALLAVRRVALVSAGLDALAFPVADPTAWHWAVLGCGATGILLDRCRQRLGRARLLFWTCATLVGLGLVEAAQRRMARHVGLLGVHMLDVGQGDATAVEFPNGQAMLVDAGGFVGSPVDPGERAVWPWLRARRRTELRVVALSHPHPDHFTGLLSLIDRVKVDEFWDTGQGQVQGAGPVYAALLHRLRERGVPILRPTELCGKVRRFGVARVEVVAPCPGFVPDRGANDNSLVMKVSYGQRSFLLTGDAEAAEEADLVSRSLSKLRADVLKVGHHGSRTSSGAALLAAVQPTFSTISCGVRNRFGHPHPTTLAQLSARGIAALRTDRMGSLSFATDGERLDLYAFSVPR